MTRLVRAELFKLRTTSLWWLLAAATFVSTGVMLAIDLVQAHELLQPFDAFVALHAHGRTAAQMPPEFLNRLRGEWNLGHSALTQAATIFTAGQLIGVLLTCLLGVVLVTGEYHQQTATTTYLLTPRRGAVVVAKLCTAVIVAAASWLASTALALVAGAVFLSSEGYGTQLGQWGVLRAVLLNLAAYTTWAVFGVGFGALIRSQLTATVAATVLYLVGAAAAGGVFDLLYTYVIKQDWILAAQVVVPSVASAVMISPTKTFDQSPPQWVGAAVLLGYAAVTTLAGTSLLRRRDVS
ncbi:ABC transporter permease subunit [Dactylosporangium sp. NPDC051485]|uniref:ABC transporter permease subunit n=1 Tax=Dactylosporangium sp. NPDC051485 TaxID=3154846 RepID=UPI003424E73D